MNDQIKQIAERLRGLRDVLELTSEAATVTSLPRNTGSQRQEITTFPSACYKR